MRRPVRRAPHRPAPTHSGADTQFIAMLDAYRDSGGLARADEMLALFRRSCGPDPSTLAQWIGEREVLCFEWKSLAWFPWFQFDRRTLQPHPQLRAIYAELTAIYDPWELANWFAEPNPGLAEYTPVHSLFTHADDVLDAARAERFMVNG